MRNRTAVHYNPSSLHNHHHNVADNDDDDDNRNNEIRPPTVDHILWQEKANEFIKQCYKNENTTTKQRQQSEVKILPFIRHSTGGNNSNILYKHPSAIAMMTLNKRASQGDIPREDGLILSENNGFVGNELLTAGKRHLRDLFSGDLGVPPVPPPPPMPLTETAMRTAPSQRTHVGNVVHTFETLAMQRRLAAFKQHEQQQQFRVKKQQQKRENNSKFSKYLKSNNNKQKYSATTTTTAITNNNFTTHIKCNNNTTFNERNKQISQQYLQQMEIDYRKNLFSKQSHVNNNKNHKFKQNSNNNNNNTDTISEGEAGVVAKFDEMLAGYSTNPDCDDDNDDHNNDNNNSHISIININRNESENNLLHINLSSTNGGATTKVENVTDTCTDIKQLECNNTNQGLLPIMRKKLAAPLPPPKPLTKTTTTTTMATLATNSKQQHESCNNVLNKSQHYNQVESNAQLVESNPFLRGTTLSQSFVCQSNWQHRNKKPRAPKPPILPITTSVVKNITKNKQLKTNTQLCIAITNPFRHVLRFNTKNSDSFNLLQNVN